MTVATVNARAAQGLRSASGPPAAMPRTQASSAARRTSPRGFGKYREIILAVAFFLLFDLAVLVLNFYVSFQISQDAVSINLSGRQRMLSQRTAKALYAVESNLVRGLPVETDLKELRAASGLFDVTLRGFESGASVPGGDSRPVFLPATDSPTSRRILADAQKIWQPYLATVNTVLAGVVDPAAVAIAADYARGNNLKLLALMNELTTDLESSASARANTMRMVQTGGIVLALINFVFILFKFIRRLQASDVAVDAANDENREILASVREGLFLITPDLKLGSQISHSVDEIFGRIVAPGQNFLGLLEPLVSEKTLKDAREYVHLLFSEHVKEQLVQGLNPLSEVELSVTNRLGETKAKYISLQFNRAYDGTQVRHLLVTVQDITRRMELERELLGERRRAQQEFDLLLKAMDSDPGTLRQFVSRSESLLMEVNDLLKSASDARGEVAITRVIDGVYRRIHSFKGDASMLGLDMLAQLAHQFESDLVQLKQSGAASGANLLALPLPLEELLDKLQSFKSLATKVGAEAAAAADTAPEPLSQQLASLGTQAAKDLGKQVGVQAELDALSQLHGDKVAAVRETMVQLVRNAVVHGIEAPAVRQTARKAQEGKVTVALQREHSGDYLLSVRDDGGGIDLERVRARLIDLGWFNARQLADLEDRQILMQIFRPGFSTAKASLHGGRGVGLDVVQAAIQRLGGRLTLWTALGQGTEFRIRFAA